MVTAQLTTGSHACFKGLSGKVGGPGSSLFLGADRCDNSSAEIICILWSLAWLLQAQVRDIVPVTIWPDNEAAGAVSSGQAVAKAHKQLVAPRGRCGEQLLGTDRYVGNTYTGTAGIRGTRRPTPSLTTVPRGVAQSKIGSCQPRSGSTLLLILTRPSWPIELSQIQRTHGWRRASSPLVLRP